MSCEDSASFNKGSNCTKFLKEALERTSVLSETARLESGEVYCVIHFYIYSFRMKFLR